MSHSKAAYYLTTALDRIERDPSSWDQATYHCGTTHCLTGHIDMIIQEELNASGTELGYIDTQYNYLVNDVRVVLGMGEWDWICIVDSRNDLAYLKKAIAEYIETGEVHRNFNGVDRDGNKEDRFDRDRFDSDGFDAEGFDSDGLDDEGLDVYGFNRHGFITI